MNPTQKAAHNALVLDGLHNQHASLLGDLREQKGKLSRSVRLAGIDPVWGQQKYADAAAARIAEILKQLKIVDARIASAGVKA